MEWNADLVLQTLVKATEQCTATSKVDAIAHNVGVKLRRGLLQNLDNRSLQLGQRLVEAMGYLH